MDTSVKEKGRAMKSQRGRSERKAVAADITVGVNVRQLRTEAGITLAELAAALGLSHQQLQKYETGANRISAGMLLAVARYFSIPVDALFEGCEGYHQRGSHLDRARQKSHAIIDRETSPETLGMMAKVLRAMASK